MASALAGAGMSLYAQHKAKKDARKHGKWEKKAHKKGVDVASFTAKMNSKHMAKLQKTAGKRGMTVDQFMAHKEAKYNARHHGGHKGHKGQQRAATRSTGRPLSQLYTATTSDKLSYISKCFLEALLNIRRPYSLGIGTYYLFIVLKLLKYFG